MNAETQNLTVTWEIPNKESFGFVYKIMEKRIDSNFNDLNEFKCYINSSLVTDSQSCKILNGFVSHLFSNLKPGNDYIVSVKMFRFIMTDPIFSPKEEFSSENQINVSTRKIN